ncbi:translation initiation factor 4E [Strigomonas culicis]|uniref:Translation initiation factor 4E n=1 Tax=Strigomonas culicis TaxID=28005 RepID=S9US19_9TRYP|nr:translation initiation factor 4E [Strigomonas culicis]|eukprot:EPY31713.1 translation initiation factor 4E [Strigomonas culicis]
MIMSPITLMPAAHPRPGAELDDDDDAERNLAMMLDDLWCLFYLPQVGESIQEDTYNPTLVFRIDSVPTFWKVANNIPQPTQLPQCTLYLFRDGIDPRWEDPANLSGGIVKVKINHSHATVFNDYSADPNAADSQETINEAWELLLCRTIGDSWSSSVRGLVNGIALKVRGRAYVLEVWVTRQTQELMRDLAELWQGVLGDAFVTAYYPHAALQERSHQGGHGTRRQEGAATLPEAKGL